MLRSIEWQQQTIAENEGRFHGAIHEAPIPIMITGDSGEVVELNRARQDITAYTMDEVRTMASWSSLAWNEEDAALPAGISRLRREKSGDNRRFQKPLFQLNLSPLTHIHRECRAGVFDHSAKPPQAMQRLQKGLIHPSYLRA